MNGSPIRWKFDALLVTFVLALQGCTFPVKQMEFSAIEGRVTDKETGAPVEGAVVYVHWQEGKESLMERYPAAPMFVAETITDSQGRFFLPEGGPNWALFSKHLTAESPLIGIIKNGYELYHTGLTHETAPALPNRQIHIPSSRRCCEFVLRKMSVQEIMKGDGMVRRAFFSTDVSRIARSGCWWERIPLTVRRLDELAEQVRSLGLPVSLFTSENIPENKECKDAKTYFTE